MRGIKFNGKIILIRIGIKLYISKHPIVCSNRNTVRTLKKQN